MPLLLKKSLFPDVLLGVWKIDESFEDFCILYPWLKQKCCQEINSYKSEQRKCEILAVQLLIREFVGDNVSLFHERNGRPYLSNGLNVGISHTCGYAVVVISCNKNVSVDIEFINQRVLRIKDRFMRADECAYSLIQYILHWCTKETLYKMFSEDKLSFGEMQLLSIEGDDSDGIITAKNILRNQLIKVYYFTINNVIITYSAI